jgi:hypothetical protein
MRRWGRALIAGLAGGVAWNVGMLLTFGPAQRWLADPELQSPKMFSVFADPELPPRMNEAPWIVPVMLLGLGVLYGLCFAAVREGLPGQGRLARGLSFGVLAWALGFFWFELYLPWNVLREPAPLVLLELCLWLLVLLGVGATISFVYAE